MAKQLNVNLAFTADTSKAKQQLQELQRTLSGLTTSSAQKSPLGITDEINSAIADVSKLEVALKNATTHTGSLDLGQFLKEIDKAGLSAEKIANQLATLGPEGRQAFAQLTQSIMTAEVPLKRTSTLLTDFAITLKNTARWQISSSILHGFVGSIQTAYHYAQDLNESLNNIRIVTGKSVEEMADFAKEANSAAKALSTTTTAYTDASLIYYQQGLDDQQVQERTNVTVKMANVTRESAEDVSQQLTAVWNNFDKGGENLEYYADVMTALGAATASSTDEIAEGLEKFAAVADTVGLSYEYATSALATVTATTRQSADIVGNAFKTLFARIEGLQLGETLDDGTDLNKYSQALEAVGVNIKDTNGDMKDMDQILDELGAKWQTLGKDQQIALAQTVAGVRQYTQMIALMDNWDFFQENLDVAKGSEGTLQEQADIYAESWEAAEKRVSASLETIYQELIDDKFFIKLGNIFADLVEGVDTLISAIGGLEGVLPLIGILILKIFGKDLSNSIDKFIYNIQISTEKGRQKIIQERKKFNDELIKIQDEGSLVGGNSSFIYQQQGEVQNLLIEKTLKLQALKKDITKEEQQQLNLLMDINRKTGEEYQNDLKNIELLSSQTQKLKTDIINRAVNVGITNSDDGSQYTKEQLRAELDDIEKIQKAYNQVYTLKEGFLKLSNQGNNEKDLQKTLESITEQLEKISPQAEDAEGHVAELWNAFEKLKNAKGANKINKAFVELEEVMSSIGIEAFDKIVDGITGTDEKSKQLRKDLEDLRKNFDLLGEKEANAATILNSYNKTIDTLKNNIANLKGSQLSFSQGFITGARSLSNFAMGLSSIKSIISTLNDESISTDDRFISIATSVGMLVPAFKSSISEYSRILTSVRAYNAEVTISNALLKVATSNQKEKTVANQVAAMQQDVLTFAEMQNNLTDEESILIDKLKNASTEETIALLGSQNIETLMKIGLTKKEAAAIIKAKLATDGLNKSMWASPITWVIAGLAALAAAYTVINKQQEEYRKNQAEQAKEELEEIKKYQEEVKAHKELITSYQELVKQQQQGEDVAQSLKDKMYELAEAYDEIDGKILLATDHTATFNQRLKEARQNELQENVSKAEQGLESAAKEGANTGKGKIKSGNYKFQTSQGFSSANLGDVDEVKDILSDYNFKVQTRYSGGQVPNPILDVSKTYDISKPKEYLNYVNDINNAIKDFKTLYGDKAESKDVYKDLVKEQKANKEAFKEVKAQYEEYSKNLTELQFVNADLNKDTSVEELQEYIKTAKDALSEDSIMAEEDIDKYVDKYLSGIDEISLAYEKINLSGKIGKQIGKQSDEDLKEILNKIDNLNEAGLAVLDLHLNTLTAKEDLQQWIDENQVLLEASSEKQSSVSMGGVLKDYNEKEGFSQKTISTIFENENNAQHIKMSQEEFGAAEQSEQLNALTNAWIEATKAAVEYREDAIQSLQGEIGELEEEQATTEESTSQARQRLEQALGGTKKYADSTDELEEIIQKAAKGEEELTSAEEAKLEIFAGEVGTTKEDLIADQQLVDQYEKRKDTIKTLEAEIEDLKNLEEDHITASEKYKQVLSLQNSEMDDIQSNYQQLVSIVDDYNETGEWTIDNVQQLINMDDRYVASLQFENGQLVLNEEAFKGMTLAKLDDLEQTVLLKMHEDLLALAQQHAADTAGANAKQQQFQAAMVRDGIAAAKEGAAAWDAFAAAQAAAAGVSDTAYADKVKEITDSTYNRLQAIEDAKNSVEAGGSSFKKTMGGSSSGDSGEGSSAKETKNRKKADDELDRYWDINNAIKATSNRFEELSDEMEKTQAVADHLFGKALIANLKQQNEQLERENALVAQQRTNYQALYAEQRRELSELESKLSGFGAQFNGDALANYSSLLSGALAAYNAAIDAYNASAQEDADKLALEAAEKQYTEIKETIDRYRTLYYTDMADTQDKLRDLEQQELENRLKILENNLKSWEVEIKLKLNITEAKRKWDEFLKEVKQDFRKIYEDLTINSKFDRSDFFTYVDDVGTTLGAIRSVEAEMNKLKNGGSSDMFYDITEAQEKLKELQEQLIENGKSLSELYKQVWKNYIDGLDQTQDKLEDINKQYERIDDELEYEKELIELLYGDKAYALMDKYYKAQSKNILAQIDSMRTQVNFWQSEFNKAYQMNKDKHNVDLNDMSTWTEDMQKAYKNMQDAQANLNDLILEGVKLLQKDYLNAINEVIDTMDKNIWDMSLDDLKDNWDHIQKIADEYLDDIEGAYKIQALANKIDQSIANTSSLQSQQKLQKLREEEIAMLREKENLTQDDIDLAEARYQIALKEIALEEAQQNKTSMKLTRDTSGNWTYQYVADEEDIMTKQQELLDAYNNLYQTADEAYAHAMELATDAYETMQEKIREIAEDMTLSEEEKMQRIQEIYDTYLPEIEAAVGNSELYRQEAMMATSAVFAEVCEQDEEAYDTLTNAQKEMVDAVRDNHLEDYEEIRAAIVDGVYPELNDAAKTTFEETNMNSKTAAADIITDWAKNNGSSVRSMINAAINDMQKHIQNYEKELDNLQKIAGANFDKLGQMINKTSDKINNLNDKTKQLCDDSAGYLSALRSYVDEVAKAWDRVIAQIQTAKAELGDYLSLQFGGSSRGGSSGGSGNTGSGSSGSGSSGSGGSGSGGSGGGDGKLSVGDTATFTGQYYYDSYGLSPIGSKYSGVANGVVIDNVNNNPYGIHIHSADGKYGDLGWVEKSQLSGYDTGGYTGTWDNTGRLALLHQKELVLNADDTSNILKTVSAIRDLTSLNSSISSAIATSIGSMAMNLVANGGGNINTNSNSNAENQFYITAEFPNANDVETIREAILSLPNLASQYIHKNK